MNIIFISILTFWVGIGKVVCNEPVCSKFAYEEQLLAKMIRMEFNVEKMKEEMTNIRDLVKKELISLQAEREHFKTKFELIHDEHTQESVFLQAQRENITTAFGLMKEEYEDAMSEKFKEKDNVLKNQETQIMVMSEDLRILANNTVQKLTDLASTPIVAFRSRGIADIDMGMNQIMIFTKTILNEGQGYDNKTGKFTAPVSGVYIFTSQLCTYNGKYVFYDLVVNGEVTKRGSMYGYNTFSCHSVDAVVTMIAGMEVWLQCSDGGSHNNHLYYHEAYTWNMFSGVLINKLN